MISTKQTANKPFNTKICKMLFNWQFIHSKSSSNNNTTTREKNEKKRAITEPVIMRLEDLMVKM